MKQLITAALCTALLAGAAPAKAHVTDHSDPDDVRGKLDVRKASLEHDGFDYVVSITTYKGWGRKALKGISGGMNIYLDTAGDDRLNYYAVIYTKKNKKMACDLYNRKGDLKAEADASKRGSSTAVCELPAGRIKRDSKTVKWAVQTSWRLSQDNYTYDYVPNEGYFKHKIPR